MSTSITWYGQAVTVIESENKTLLIDPWFNGNPVCPVKYHQLKQVDIVAVTHGHFDHFGDALEVCRHFGAKLVSTPEIAWYADGKGIPRGKQALPLGYGGKLEVDNYVLAMYPAVHPSALYGVEWASQRQFIPDGGAASYIIRTPDRRVLYHAGDTALFSDMKIIGEREHPEVGLLPICGRFNMDARDATIAAEWLQVKRIIPIHYNTNQDLIADPKELADAVASREREREVVVLKPGERYSLE